MSDDAKYYVLATKTKRLIGNGSIDAEIYTTHLNIFIMFIILYSFIILHFDHYLSWFSFLYSHIWK